MLKRKLIAGTLALSLIMSSVPSVGLTSAKAETKAGGICLEDLGRGMSVISTGSGQLVSWRYLLSDADNAVYKLYRNGSLIYTSNDGEATCYLDKSGKSSDKYTVETLEGGKVVREDGAIFNSSTDYLQINLDQPTASGCTYSPNDCSVGDADGDGEYEIFLKWDPSNSKDNSQSGVTGNVYIDCIKLNGTRLWRIDLGPNIRAGAHYTQFLVADFDCDGYAEMTCKTADGTVDGKGKVIGTAGKKYANSDGYILSGPEYYTLFDGRTGAALDTVNYNPQRGTVSNWGDKYGNRVDRFLGTVAYLDGVHPSAVTMRGYYTRMTACAYDVVDKKLVQRWYFDTGNTSSVAGYGDGNHNCMPADVDGDGKQEIITGNTCIDDNGKLLWCLNMGHGDAMHVGDFLPNRDGLELWICHEDKPYGVTLVDATRGIKIFHVDGEKDTGRCCADNVWAGNPGAEFWGLGNTVYDGTGTALSCSRPAINFLSYWDGDLEREILDGYTDSPAKISKMTSAGKITQLMETTGYYTCNTTKGTPCLSADILGDWREELIVRAADGKSIRIYCTTYATDYRITTLMHDPQYRNQVSAQQTAYNQPPHPSFYLGSDAPLPKRSSGGTIQDDDKPAKETKVEVKFNTFTASNGDAVLDRYFGNGCIKVVGSMVYKTAKDSAGNATTNVTGVDVDKNNSEGFAVKVRGNATLNVTASSNGSSNTSAIRVLDSNGNVVAESDGKTSVTGGSSSKIVFSYELTDGEYTVVCPSTSANNLRIIEIEAIGNLVSYTGEETPAYSKEKQGLCKADDGNWYYYVDNAVATTKTGIVQNASGNWYVKDGKIDFTKRGVVNDNGIEYVVHDGYMSTGFYGLTKKDDGTWAYAEAGVLTYAYTGLANNEAGWWFVTDGVIDFKYTGIGSNATGDYRVVNGQIDFKYDGWFNANGNWWYMKGGMVDRNKAGLVKKDNSYFYVENGEINFKYTGLATNAGNTYYVKDGYLDFGFSGTVTIEGTTYKVVEGMVR